MRKLGKIFHNAIQFQSESQHLPAPHKVNAISLFSPVQRLKPCLFICIIKLFGCPQCLLRVPANKESAANDKMLSADSVAQSLKRPEPHLSHLKQDSHISHIRSLCFRSRKASQDTRHAFYFSERTFSNTELKQMLFQRTLQMPHFLVRKEQWQGNPAETMSWRVLGFICLLFFFPRLLESIKQG